ncbi:MAG: class I SAM-dependent methyltransferase [Bacteroidetes bacterium]|nr:class I SAM-dependent methyltransferase [Bacteroidota bacterium]
MGKTTDWENYYKVHKDRPAREILVKALDMVKTASNSDIRAFDLGCGNGHETHEMLKRGWHVTATDINENITELLSDLKNKFGDKLDIQIVSFENIKWHKADLINAHYSLPFCPKEHFDNVWHNIRNSLKVNGIFTGQFFGDRDEWDLVKLSREEALEKLDGMKKELFTETEKDGATATGEMKHWHLFDIIARKIS